MPDVHQILAGPDPAGRSARRARLQRDAALDRVGSVTRKIAVGSIAAAVALGFYVSRALPGHSTRPATSGSVGPSTGTGSTPAGSAGGTGTAVPAAGGSGGSSTGAGGSSNSLSQPASPPSQTQQQAPVVSGST
jgi:hypothetical protein